MYQEMIMSIPSYKNDSVVTDAWDAVQQHVSSTVFTIYIIHGEILHKKIRGFIDCRTMRGLFLSGVQQIKMHNGNILLALKWFSYSEIRYYKGI